MKTYTTQEIGRIGEKTAARYLKKKGFRILSKNKHLGKNELDLVAADKTNVLFVEVKTRTYEHADTDAATRPADAVDLGKRQRTVKAAFDYLHEHPTNKAPRLDVIEVCLDRSDGMRPFLVNHIENAFSVKGAKRA